MQPIGSLFGVFYTWSVRVFHLDQTVLLLLKQLENFNIVHPLNLFTEMRSRGAISLLRVIRACGRMLVLSQGDLGGSLTQVDGVGPKHTGSVSLHGSRPPSLLHSPERAPW